MANPIRRGESSSQVSSWSQSDTVTPSAQTSFILPYGLTLRQKVGQANITNITASAGTVTYTAANNYSAGDTVGIYDANPVAYNLRNVTVASASSTQFTVTNAATGTYVSGGIVQKTGFMSVTIPAGITWVYAIAVGGGGSGQNGGGGGGGLSWGWTLASSTCIIGKQDTYTRYGQIIAGNGGNGNNASGVLGGGGGTNGSGSTNYWGIPGGAAGGNLGAGGGGGGAGATPTRGGNGISGGGGGFTNTANVNGANGGSGVIGGGGGGGVAIPGGTGGNGGNGINILTGEVILGGTGQAIGGDRTAPGGGAGCVTKGLDGVSFTGGNGGLGGGGGGGAGYTPAAAAGDGILYIFY